MKAQAFTRADFDKLPVGQAFKIVREAHRARVKFDHGSRVNTEQAATSFKLTMRDLAEALDGTDAKYSKVTRGR